MRIYFIILILTLFSCSKDRLTPATQTGANTFSCKIDGKVFKPAESGGLSFGGPPITVYNLHYNGFTLLASYNRTDNGQTPKDIVINLHYLQSIGIYELKNFPNAVYRYSYAYGPEYHTNNTYTGQINITRCDTVNKIYSGTFFFRAINDSTGKIVNITDGRFDVKE